jgi:hypothetical protein
MSWGSRGALTDEGGANLRLSVDGLRAALPGQLTGAIDVVVRNMLAGNGMRINPLELLSGMVHNKLFTTPILIEIDK